MYFLLRFSRHSPKLKIILFVVCFFLYAATQINAALDRFEEDKINNQFKNWYGTNSMGPFDIQYLCSTIGGDPGCSPGHWSGMVNIKTVTEVIAYATECTCPQDSRVQYKLFLVIYFSGHMYFAVKYVNESNDEGRPKTEIIFAPFELSPPQNFQFDERD